MADDDIPPAPTVAIRLHETKGFGCWCRPSVSAVCPECDGEEADAMPCWRCGGEGVIPCPDPELYDGAHALIIVHNDETDAR